MNYSFRHPHVREDVSMAPYTSFRAGGRARYFLEVQSADEIIAVTEEAKEQSIPFYILGNGSNTLVRDGGYHGLIIKIGSGLSAMTVNDTILTAGAGALLSSVANCAMEASLSGLEFASGIPGSVGGGVRMNAGAYDGEIKDVLYQAKIYDPSKGVVIYDNPSMDFGYRHSAIDGTERIILEVQFELTLGRQGDIKGKMDDFNRRRAEKQPLQYPSAGSTFKRPPNHYAGRLIEESGLKGLQYGDAQVALKHAGFIINRGHASATDIETLMDMVILTVQDKFGVTLEPEVQVIGERL